MRVFWERMGLFGPVYRFVGQGFSDRDIAKKLNLTEPSVQVCRAWILHFLGFTTGTNWSDTLQLRGQCESGPECEPWAGSSSPFSRKPGLFSAQLPTIGLAS
jgi:hypothetical protein